MEARGRILKVQTQRKREEPKRVCFIYLCSLYNRKQKGKQSWMNIIKIWCKTITLAEFECRQCFFRTWHNARVCEVSTISMEKQKNIKKHILMHYSPFNKDFSVHSSVSFNRRRRPYTIYKFQSVVRVSLKFIFIRVSETEALADLWEWNFSCNLRAVAGYMVL